MILNSKLVILAMFSLFLTACTGFAPAPGPGMDRKQLTDLRSATVEMRGMLEKYYAGSGVLENSWYLPGDHPARDEGLRFLANRFARAIVWQDSLVIGTIGSSVTAGHDNCRYDCYQQQLERLLGPVLSTAGVRFEVRNTGQGGNCGDSFDNQIFCLPMLVGDEVDITHYSWTYFESGKGSIVAVAHEMFYRWSLMMDHSPVPQLIYANDCNRFQQADQALLYLYAEYGADVLCMTRGLAEVGYQRGQWGEMGNPLHSTSREGELPGTSIERSRSLGVMYRNWHPGPLLFQTTADALAWRYSTALLLALDMVESEPAPAERWPRKPDGLTLADLPPLTQCKEPWCKSQNLPSCINFEKPTFGNPGVELTGVESSGWEFHPGEPVTQRAIPPEEKDLPQCIHPNRCSGWVAAAGEPSGWLSFSLPELEIGLVAVCCGSKRCGQKLVDARPEFLLNGQPPATEPEILWNSKCVKLQVDLNEKKPGETTELSIRLPAMKDPLPPVTHVFGL